MAAAAAAVLRAAPRDARRPREAVAATPVPWQLAGPAAPPGPRPRWPPPPQQSRRPKRHAGRLLQPVAALLPGARPAPALPPAGTPPAAPLRRERPLVGRPRCVPSRYAQRPAALRLAAPLRTVRHQRARLLVALSRLHRPGAAPPAGPSRAALHRVAQPQRALPQVVQPQRVQLQRLRPERVLPQRALPRSPLRPDVRPLAEPPPGGPPRVAPLAVLSRSARHRVAPAPAAPRVGGRPPAVLPPGARLPRHVGLVPRLRSPVAGRAAETAVAPPVPRVRVGRIQRCARALPGRCVALRCRGRPLAPAWRTAGSKRWAPPLPWRWAVAVVVVVAEQPRRARPTGPLRSPAVLGPARAPVPGLPAGRQARARWPRLHPRSVAARWVDRAAAHCAVADRAVADGVPPRRAAPLLAVLQRVGR